MNFIRISLVLLRKCDIVILDNFPTFQREPNTLTASREQNYNLDR